MTSHTDPLSQLQFESPGEGNSRGWTAAEAQCLRFREKFVQKCKELNELVEGLNQVSSEHDRVLGFVVRNLISVIDNCEAALQELGKIDVASDNFASAVEQHLDDQPLEKTFGATHVGLNAAAAENTADQSGEIADGYVEQRVEMSESDGQDISDQTEHRGPVANFTSSAEDKRAATAKEGVEMSVIERHSSSHASTQLGDADLGQDTETPRKQQPIVGASGSIPQYDAIESAGLESVKRSIVHVLEGLGVVRVNLLGCTYTNVVFDGHPIEDPFEIVESTQTGKATEMTVREVVSDLWILQQGGCVRVVSKGQVVC